MPSNAEIRDWLADVDSELRSKGHRVSVYAIALGDHLGISEDRLRNLRVAVLCKVCEILPRLEWETQPLLVQETEIVETALFCEAGLQKGTYAEEMSQVARVIHPMEATTEC